MGSDFDPVQAYGYEEHDRERLLEHPLPHSGDAERVSLGACFIDNSLFDHLAEMVVSDNYYVRAHQHVFRAMLAVHAKGGELNPILVGEELRREGVLEQVGGVAFLSELTSGLPFVNNVAAYAKVIKDHSDARQGVKVCNKTTSEFLEGEYDVDEIFDRHEEMVYAIRHGKGKDESFVEASVSAASSLDRAAQLADSGTVVSGVSTGFKDFDAKTHGLQNKDLIIVAGRPSMGKTSWALNVAANAAIRTGVEVAVFSLEMSREGLSGRLLCSEARVDHHRFLGGYLTKDEWARLAGAQTTLAEAEGKIHIDDTAGISTASMRRKVRRLNTRLAKRGKRVGLVVADYLQLMSSVSRNRNDSREREVAQMSSEQKGLAKEFDVPWILVSQLNRAADTRSGHRPQLSDLRESGAIEQDADVVAFVFREEYYDKTDENIGRAEVIVAKNRNGPTGTIDLAWFDSFTRFEDLWEDAGPTSHGGKGY